MPFRRGGGKHRRDALEPYLLAALHQLGVQTWQINGAGLPDVLAYHRGRFYCWEIKSPGGKLTPAQLPAPWPIVRSLAEACAVLGIDGGIPRDAA